VPPYQSPSILFIGRYAEANTIGGNSNVYKQAHSLVHDWGVSVQILTCDVGDGYHAQNSSISDGKILQTETIEGVVFHRFKIGRNWNEDTSVVPEQEWRNAVDFGKEIIRTLRPAIVHLQHRHSIWWMLQSAQELGVPTIYTNHDWGIACLRTLLVRGDGRLCDGRVEPINCANCVLSGRGFLGWANEMLVSSEIGRTIVKTLVQTDLGPYLNRRGVVREPVRWRSKINYIRAKSCVSKLHHLITPSSFGERFFRQLDITAEKVTILPWYSDISGTEARKVQNDEFTFGYLGRISHEKGVHDLFSALEKLPLDVSVKLQIAGHIDSSYGKRILARSKILSRRSIEVQWLGWTSPGELLNSVDAIVIPSLAMDNTPLVLIEAHSQGVPVVAPDIPTMAPYIEEGKSGYLYKYSDVGSLANALCRAATKDRPRGIPKGSKLEIASLKQYTGSLVKIYQKIMQPEDSQAENTNK
jgi:glycosyltransferase involved in cell wall biosynthesis